MTARFDGVHAGDSGKDDALSQSDVSDHLSGDDDAGGSDVDSRKGSLENRHCDGEDYGDNESDVGSSNDETGASASFSLGEAILTDIQTSHAAVGPQSSAGAQQKATVCCVCGARALYTCPGCGRRTCSMTCVRVHKDDFHCSGKRDVTAKIPLSEFTDQQLQRDFHFLEDCRRVIDNVERSFPRSTWRFTYKALPPPLHALREAARRRGVICQITSEGMRKRDVNTSRLDRKTNTIVWRCEFHFFDARHPDDSVMIGTNWGSERHHLGDVMKYCWSTNPSLLCYHINRRYNRASKYVGGTAGNKTSAATAEEGEEGKVAAVEQAGDAASARDDAPLDTSISKIGEEEAATDAVTSPLLLEARTPAAEAVAKDGDAPSVDQPRALDSSHADVVEGDKKENAVESSLTRPPELLPLRAYEEVPVMPSIEPVSPEEAAQQAYVNSFLEHEPYVILSKAERLGSETKFFQLFPHETLNETLRRLFFVNEFPIFAVVHASLLDQFPLVTEEDKEKIRGSFRSRKTHEPREKLPLRRRSDLDPEEQARLAKVPCRRFLHSRCQLGDECPYWHCTPEEIPVCRSFLRTGQCDKGVRCSFRHDPEAVRLARKRQREDGGRGGGNGSAGRGRGGFRGSSRGPRRRMD